MTPFGSPDTRLIVLRGNSGSGKSSVARTLRQAYGYGLAWVEQDYLRRILLREHDLPDAPNIGLIDQTVRYALDHGFHVVLEGILYADHYSEMLHGLQHDHAGQTNFYYFDLDFEETARRHATRPQATEFSIGDMRPWFRTGDTLNVSHERTFDASLSLNDVAQCILLEAGLLSSQPVLP
ncbi:AAA family ATPase [Deinococcus puniceus]|uniref:Kinase n=1 Tax=Deinococcus puniceus TaxID=1182568 RepID=A0A172T8J3_9DEIO|nr:AAA family ATPase [Deinococcus puniceus]ANE43266.1 kinase [Deinococcus puniceus]